MTLLTQYASQDEATIVQGMLEANGIDCRMHTDALSTLFPAPGAGGTGVSLYVEPSDVQRARELLKEHGD